MRGPGGGRMGRVRGKTVATTGFVALIGWALVGGVSAGGLEPRVLRPEQLEALAFDPFRLVTDKALLGPSEPVLRADGSASDESVTSSTEPALAPSGREGGDPVASSTAAGITSLTSAAMLVKVFVGQALLIAPRPPLRTPTRPTWP